jgi:hypothetical protein
MDLDEVSRSQVLRLHSEIYTRERDFVARSIKGDWAYL